MESRDDEEPLQQAVQLQVEQEVLPPPVEPPISPEAIGKKDTEVAEQLCCIVCSFMFFNIILGLLFYVFSTKENLYGGDNCQNLRTVSYGFALMNLIVGLLLMIMLAMIPSINGANIQKTLDCFGQAYLIFFVAQVIYSISLFTTLFENEECELLGALTYMYFWTWMIFLTGFCCCCCGIFLVGATSNVQQQPD